MPIFEIVTNVPQSKIPSDFHKTITAMMAKGLDKPASEVQVYLQAGAQVTYGGTTEPTAMIHLTTIGSLGSKENQVLSKSFGEYILRTLGVKKERYYICFRDIPKEDVGNRHTTFEVLWEQFFPKK